MDFLQRRGGNLLLSGGYISRGGAQCPAGDEKADQVPIVISVWGGGLSRKAIACKGRGSLSKGVVLDEPVRIALDETKSKRAEVWGGNCLEKLASLGGG